MSHICRVTNLIVDKSFTYVIEFVQWTYWWVILITLIVTRACGYICLPMYRKVIMHVDTEFRVRKPRRSHQTRKNKNYLSTQFILLPLAAKLCVFTEAVSVHSEHLAFLRQPLPDVKESYANSFIRKWQITQQRFRYCPPNGWPLKLSYFIFSIMSVMLAIFVGYKRILKAKKKAKQGKQHNVYSTSNNISEMRSEVFDAYSDTIIVDNSANCVIWRHKRNFVPSTYKKLDPSMTPDISTASGPGYPIAIGNLNIGWYADSGLYHNFVRKDSFHIPSSPVNVLGLSAFSKSIGDYNTSGTRINSSGQESIFSWDNNKFQRSFSHSEANMPELPVNDGYTKFHKFCNFIEHIQPISKQCYSAFRTVVTNPIHDIPYKIGEEVLYKNNDHVEKGVIENICIDKQLNDYKINVKFRGGRKIDANRDNIMALDETDVSQVPYTSQEFLQHAKCLTAEELDLLKHPLPLTPLQKEWKVLHDKLGHISFRDMDKLVHHGCLPRKFASLKGTTILCPSCMFGKMKKRAWRTKGTNNLKHIRKETDDAPGAKVSTDQLVVAQPGLVPRISGRHTHLRICGATGFLDHFTNYSYSSMQTSLDGDQTVQAKNNFESHALTCGVRIKSYRADNGRFAEKIFEIQSEQLGKQSIFVQLVHITRTD